MKNKILTSVIITVIFALVSASSLFIVMSNVQEINKTKATLKSYADFVVIDNIKDMHMIENYKIDNINVRVTHINHDGTVLYDSIKNSNEDHLSRIEVIDAINKGEGYSVRVSSTTEEKMVYYARSLSDGTILRIAVPFKNISLFSNENIMYWIFIIVSVFTFSIFLSMKLVRAIVEPLKDLENVTAQIANGDLHIRVAANGNTEIASLGNTFNNMADQLQNQINKVVDRQNRLESILSCMESGVIAVNRRNRVIIINPYAKRIFGIKGDITGELISDKIKDYDINKFINEDNEFEMQLKLLHPVERELKIKKASIIYDLEKIGKVITVQDITDIKRLENIRSQFVANVSHELKTPLTSIKGFAETLKYVEDDDTRNKFLDIINKEAERLSRLINDILVLSKIESEVVGEEDEFLPNTIIQDVLSTVRALGEQKNISINLEESNSYSLYGDKDRFFQLVLNLVENAIKYSENNTKITINSYSDKEFYYISVEDEGLGIPEDDLPRIFERFYRVDKARKSGGTGLGLAIVKHIVKIFNGDIKVESKLGEGSKFTVKIKHL